MNGEEKGLENVRRDRERQRPRDWGGGGGFEEKEEKEGSMGWKAEKKTGRRRGRENTWRVRGRSVGYRELRVGGYLLGLQESMKSQSP